MFAFLKRFPKTSRQVVHRIPAGVRVYAVGDIHGRADLLEDVHRRIQEDAASAPRARNLVVYLGDYVDRGTQVRKTLDILVAGLGDDFETVYLRGNHEDLMLRFLEEPALLETWMAVGGQATLLNYRLAVPGTGITPDRAVDVRDALLQALPAEHLRFLRSLHTSFQLGDYVFVHAGIRPGVDVDQQSPEDLLWIREEFLFSKASHGPRVVHGHSIVPRPEVLPNRINLDTGAFATGMLSCAVLEDDRVRLL
jgi:serine/threonine protein phosphatase 1